MGLKREFDDGGPGERLIAPKGRDAVIQGSFSLQNLVASTFKGGYVFGERPRGLRAEDSSRKNVGSVHQIDQAVQSRRPCKGSTSPGTGGDGGHGKAKLHNGINREKQGPGWGIDSFDRLGEEKSCHEIGGGRA